MSSRVDTATKANDVLKNDIEKCKQQLLTAANVESQLRKQLIQSMLVINHI